MGSKKKRTDSSDSSSDSEGSSSSSEAESTKKKSKEKKAVSNSDSENEVSKKSGKNQPSKRRAPSTEEVKHKKNRFDLPEEEADKELSSTAGRRMQNSTNEHRGRKERDDRKHDDRRNREDHRYSDDRPRNNRRPDYRDNRGDNRDRRHDRERDSRGDYRDRRDNYNRNDSDRDRNRNQRNNQRRRRSRSSSYDHANARWGKDGTGKNSDKKESTEKQKPNFALSGKLTEETNTYRGVVIKYSEPPEARKPKRRWRLYPFKGEKALQTLYIHRESAYLIGRERKVVDLPVDHPSCSKQHAALQYRLVPFTRDDGSTGKKVRPYLIDLNSANGTCINNNKIEPSKYVELFEKDVIKFGYSSREYVLLHENSKDEAQDDDVKQEPEEVVDIKQEDN